MYCMRRPYLLRNLVMFTIVCPLLTRYKYLHGCCCGKLCLGLTVEPAIQADDDMADTASGGSMTNEPKYANIH